MSIFCLPSLVAARLLTEVIPVVVVNTRSCSVVDSCRALFAHAENVAKTHFVVAEAVVHLGIAPFIELALVIRALENSIRTKLCKESCSCCVTEASPLEEP